MPERPDLEYVVPKLAQALTGAGIADVVVTRPVVLRMAVKGTAPEWLTGRVIEGVGRRAHFVHFTLDGDVDLVVSPKLAGRFVITDEGGRAPRATAVSLSLSDGRVLHYRDDVQMGQVYVVGKQGLDRIPGWAKVGLDVLDPAVFTLAAFTAIAKQRRDQVKVFLMDKTALDAMGNAYADEVLFAAGLHPKLRVRELSPDQIARLHRAILSVLTEARDEITRRAPALDDKIRDFLKVRNRRGEPCPHCATTIRAAGVNGHDAFFCPQCQPDTKGRGFVDWRKVKQ